VTMQEGTLHNWFSKSKSKDGKPGWVQSDGSPCANEKGETKTPKCYSSRRLSGLKKSKEGQKKIKSADARKSREDPGQQSKSGGSKPTMVRTFKDKKDYKNHPSGDTKKEEYEMTMQEEKDKKESGSGKKDACYNKVKSRYSVWPSAYASGALVKCRRKGASNWGNSTKKEEYENLPEFSQTQINAMRRTGIEVQVFNENMTLIKEKEVKVKDTRRTVDAIRAYDRAKDASRDATYDTDKGNKKKGDKEKAYAKKERGEIKKDDPNWKNRKYHTGMHGEGYAPGDVDQKVGAVTSISKRDQDDAKARLLAKAAKKRALADKIKEDRERIEEGMTKDEWDKKLAAAAASNQKRDKERGMKIHSTDSMKDVQDRIAARKKNQNEEFDLEGLEEARIPSQQGNIYLVTFSWRGKLMYMKVFFPEPYGPDRERVEVAMNKIYPGARVKSYDMAFVSQGDSYLNAGSPEGGDGAQKRPKK